MKYPMKLIAPLKDYLWGGMRLRDEYGKETQLMKVAESWELSCHKDGKSGKLIVRKGYLNDSSASGRLRVRSAHCGRSIAAPDRLQTVHTGRALQEARRR